MFIWTKNGNKLVKTEDIKVIYLEDETKLARELNPATRGELYAIRAYYEFDNRKNSIVLASYENIDIAKERFSQLIYAIGQGATVFSFCEEELLSDDGKSEPEEVLEMEP